ncbi:hypothetical protein Lal_00011553 [Lupinus albus]|nr:hypothetical protein Lal_00011553 [Lupinus albus]
MRLSFKTVTNVVVVLPRGRTRSIINFTLFPTITSNLVLHPLLRTPKTPSFHSSLSSPMSSHKVRDNIQLSDVEKRIFDRLLATLRFFNLQTHLRVAGGWVRDKLLGKECYDIDIALDKMMGTEFVDKVREYLLSIGEEAQGVCVIESNPDQSKHLETARMRLFDMWIDFVNLRSEEYTDNSRIPSMQRFGTPEEDAYRRDLTINSLFYNINTDSVEDFTKRGISDLKSGKIVTPLPPKATFLDDPLRVVRAIRFGARFEFTLDEDLKQAAACDEVKDALAAKISRERIGTEIDLMISGNQPVKAMTYICDLTIFWIVFSLPPTFEPAISDGCERLCISQLDISWNLIHLLGKTTFTDEQRRLTLYAAMFLPLRNTIYREKKAKKIFNLSFSRMSRDDESWTQEREETRHEREELRLRLELNEARTKKTEELLAAIATKLGVPRGDASVGEGSKKGEELERQRPSQIHNQWRKLEIPIFFGDAFGWVKKLERYFTLREVVEEERMRATMVALEGQTLSCVITQLFLFIVGVNPEKSPWLNSTSRELDTTVPVVNYIFRESLKRKAKDPETVLDLHRASNKFLSLIPCLVSNEDVQIVGHDWMTELIDVPVSSRVRVLTGFLLRELRDFWRVALLISILLHPIDVNDTEDESSQLSKRRDLFNTVENSVIKLGLEKVWDVKQLINGKDVMSVLQLKGGPMVKEWLDKAMAWQLAHPSGTAEECLDWLREANSKRVKLE